MGSVNFFPEPLLHSPLLDIRDSDISAIVKEVIFLAQIPSPTFQERARAQYVRERLEGMSLDDVEIVGHNNVIARVGRGKPTLLLAVHLDTVFPADMPIEIREREGLLIGPGVGDDALGVVTALNLLERFQRLRFKPSGSLIFAATTCEEGLGNLRGITEVMDLFKNEVKFVIAVEGFSQGKLTHQATGVERWEVHFQGSGGHPWENAGGPNPNHALVRLGSSLLSLRLPPMTTLNISILKGGESINSISFSARLSIDIRSLNQREVDRLSTFFQKEAKKIGKLEKLEVTLTPLGKKSAVHIPRSHPLVQLGEVIHKHLGIESDYSPRSTDASHSLSRGIPSLAIGIARGGKNHSKDEFLEISSISVGFKQLMLFVVALIGGKRYKKI